MATFQLLHRLPEELRYDVLERLDRADLGGLQLASRWGYEVATPLRWTEICLEDCRTQYDDGVDEHDDTPLIKILLTLARKPQLAACVQVVTHRCHLPPPAIFHELPQMPFSSQTLSTDPRTTCLLQHAVRNMVKVHTLRIIFGHPNLNDALLRCFFDKHRTKNYPVRRLWLENCRTSAGCNLSLDEHPYKLPLELDFNGLESVRFRRLPLRPGQPWSASSADANIEAVHARGSLNGVDDDSQNHPMHDSLQDGVGGHYMTAISTLHAEQSAGQRHLDWHATQRDPSLTADMKTALGIVPPLSLLFNEANLYDRRLWEALRLSIPMVPEDVPLIDPGRLPSNVLRSEIAYRGAWLDPLDLAHHNAPEWWKRSQREKLPSSDVALALCQSASSSLTSLTLDWVLMTPAKIGYSRSPQAQRLWVDIFLGLSNLRLPRLRAFQLRNGVVADTQLPQGMYLLDRPGAEMYNNDPDPASDDYALVLAQQKALDTAWLSFMEAHENLECLAWPMDHFFSERGIAAGLAQRVATVLSNLGRSLVDLRVDTMYSGIGEAHSESRKCPNPTVRERRRRFVELFASKMTKLESIKIEGGVPRDERREIIRALHACPLKKVVMIGVCCPIGNFWGPDGHDLLEAIDRDETQALEGEDKDAIWKYGPMEPEPLPGKFTFEADYGWPPSPPMLNTIASSHANTVTELKFCGYKGAPVLFMPTPITTPMLSALKHFHNLRTLVMSLWLSTRYEGSIRDSEIISYWLNMRLPSSTALVRVTDDEPENSWENALRTKYAPDALAWRITSFLGPFLSDQAKSRKGGVNVRASFCIGEGGSIFDIDVNVGKGGLGNICLGFKGPREELEGERRRSKLENRRWF